MTQKLTNSRLNQAQTSPSNRKRQPRTFRQHLMRRVIIIVPAAILMLLASKLGLLPIAADKAQFDDLAWFDNNKLTEHLRILVKKQGLLDAERKCIVPIINGADPADATHVQFLVRATEGCPGLNGKTGTKFTILVDKVHRRLQTDAGSTGVYHDMPSQ